jgi:hypothetical protein
MTAFRVDHEFARRFLLTAYEPSDWIAVFLKSYRNGQVAQRVGPIAWAAGQNCQAWLRRMNSRGFNVYVSVNAISAGSRSRTRSSICAVRHVFLEADNDGHLVLSSVKARHDLPRPSYVLHSSPRRFHLFWRATTFDATYVERLQKQLARELGTDPAATPVTQNTRLPGFFNHKHDRPHLVTVQYRDVCTRYGPRDFPEVTETQSWNQLARPHFRALDVRVTGRARRYLASVPPAIAGQHGDVHTFRVCCRLIRGFALNEEQALEVLSEWNARCQPPWSFDELLDKIHRAERYGREPVGGLL